MEPNELLDAYRQILTDFGALNVEALPLADALIASKERVRTEGQAWSVLMLRMKEQYQLEISWLEEQVETVLPQAEAAAGEALTTATEEIGEGYRLLDNSLTEVHASWTEETLEAHQEMREELRDLLADSMDRTRERVELLVQSTRESGAHLLAKIEEALTAVEKTGGQINSLASDLSQFLDTVDEAQSATGGGLQAAAGALRSIKSVMDEIV